MSEQKIFQLDESVIKRIAAGEVINFPANVAKELLENSIDAGSRHIKIELRNGGYSLIRITDNGCGIGLADLPLACQRHATSKIQSFKDIQNVTTFGFRGEALFSMSCVSHLNITSKTANSSFGYSGNYEDGTLIGELTTTPMTNGTTVTIADLFYNKPSRLRTSPDASAQNRKILQIAMRYAIAYPHVSISVYCDDKEKMMTLGDNSNHYDVISLLYGVDARASTFVHKADIAKNTSVEMYLGSPSAKKQLKESAVFVNGRLVQCDHIKRAINAVYSGFLMRDEKPFAFVMLTMPPDKVDVNVHPTKKDVIFTNEQTLIDNICSEILDQLRGLSKTRPFNEGETKPKKNSQTKSQAEYPKLSSIISSREITRSFPSIDDDNDIPKSNETHIITENQQTKIINESNINSRNENQNSLISDQNSENIKIRNEEVSNIDDTAQNIDNRKNEGVYDYGENSRKEDNHTTGEKSQISTNNETETQYTSYQRNDDNETIQIQNEKDNDVKEESDDEQDSIVEESPVKETKVRATISIEDRHFEVPTVSLNESNLTDISSESSEPQSPNRRMSRNPYMRSSVEFSGTVKEITEEPIKQQTNIPSSLFTPGVDKQKPFKKKPSNIFEELKFSPKSMGRGDPNIQTLEQVLTAASANETRSRDPNAVKREMNLKGAAALLADEKSNNYDPLSTIFRAHSFVGLIGMKYGLISADETLYAVHLFQVFRVLFYQSSLANVGNFGRIKFEEPINITNICSLINADGNKIASILIEHSEMLSDLFNIKINENGLLLEMPMIVVNYEPTFSMLPLFLSRLADAEWDGEIECIGYICNELAMLYSPTEEDGENENLQIAVRDILFPELKTSIFFPPAELISNLSFIRVRSLHEMYKIFERN